MKISELLEYRDPKSTYRTGNCDTMAFALHNLTGLPFGAWAGSYYDNFTEETEYEYCHLCVVTSFDNQTWIDVDGQHQGIPDNCHFSNPVKKIELVPLSKNEAAELFTSIELNQRAIKTAEQFIMRDPNLSKLIK
jgi:hypothetical protein